MIHERAAIAYALVSTDVVVYPKRWFLSYFPPRDRAFGEETLKDLKAARAGLLAAAANRGSDESPWLAVLADDALKVERFLTQLLESGEGWDPATVIDAYVGHARTYLQENLGLPWERLPHSIHDRYPRPIDWNDVYAFTVLRKLTGGPDRGVYYRRDHLFPGVVEISTLHENVHVAAPGPGSHRAFDNGIADFLGSLIHLHITGDATAVFAYRDYLAEVSPSLTEYPQYCRAIASLVLQIGLGGLLRLVRARMRTDALPWSEIYESARRGQATVDALPRETPMTVSDELGELERTAVRLGGLLVYPGPTWIVSPSAYLFFRSTRDHGEAGVEALAKELGVDDSEVLSVRDELVSWRLIREAGSATDPMLNYQQPGRRFTAANMPDVLGPRSLRVAPDASRPVRDRRALTMYVYASALVARISTSPRPPARARVSE